MYKFAQILSQNLLTKHPNPKLQILWNCFQINLLIFPLFPALGSVSIAITALVTWKQEFNTIINQRVNQGFAILSLWLILIACFAYHRPEAFLGLTNFIPYFIVFAALSTLIHSINQLRQIAWILIITSVLVVIIGLGQMFLGWAGTPQLQAVLGWAIAANGNPIGRMASVFMYANIFAGYLIIVFILGLGLWLAEWQLITNKNSPLIEVLSVFKIGFLSLAVLGSAIALILTNSRNAWGIIIVSCLAFAIYQGWQWLVIVVTTIASIVIGAAFAPSPINEFLRKIVPAFFWGRLNNQMYADRAKEMLRVTQWQFTLSMTQQRPFIGWGLRNFTPVYIEKMGFWLGHPHNLFLMLMAETGIPATLFFCSLVGWILSQGVLLINKLTAEERLILFSYLVTFGGCILFNTVDVIIFDIRVNFLGWFILSAIWGVVHNYKHNPINN